MNLTFWDLAAVVYVIAFLPALHAAIVHQFRNAGAGPGLRLLIFVEALFLTAWIVLVLYLVQRALQFFTEGASLWPISL